MEHDVRDTVLYQNTKRDICRVHTFTKRKPVMRPDGELVVRVVSKEEMDRLWK
uniref:Uncharacterized protein n=1 Tax=viral metagenome TaxID=1070528 RepID=A0A6M3LGU0_9ZZZZ